MTGYRVENIWFDDCDVRLAGDLWVPKSAENVPTVIMVPGSGPVERGDVDPDIREHLGIHGIGSLAWDKPGLGGSTGDWERQPIVTGRAREVQAAIRYLQSRSDMNHSQIGLWGISQGGWIVPLVAATSLGVAFIVPVSAPGISVAEQIVYAYQGQVREAGLADDQVARFSEFLRAALQAAREGSSYDDLAAGLLAQSRQEPWFPLVAEEITPQSWELLLVRETPDLDYHLGSILPRVTCPVLAVFGRSDHLLPVESSAALFEEALARNSDSTIVVFPGADHGIRVQDPPGYAPGYLDTLSTWILQRTARQPLSPE